jgi:drug/metabolite transporter (DMT)-like permease
VTVSFALLAEPLCASVMVWLIFGELPPVAALAGGPLVIAGLFLHLSRREAPAAGATAQATSRRAASVR